jgi:hypothetical protein
VARTIGLTEAAYCPTLRYTFATSLLEDGDYRRTIHEFLRHQDVKGTMMYTHVLHWGRKEVCSPFDLLSAAKQQAMAYEILRRMQDLDLPPLTDEELIVSAEALFIEFARREATDA